jgi:hypothetical protein
MMDSSAVHETFLLDLGFWMRMKVSAKNPPTPQARNNNR